MRILGKENVGMDDRTLLILKEASGSNEGTQAPQLSEKCTFCVIRELKSCFGLQFVLEVSLRRN